MKKSRGIATLEMLIAMTILVLVISSLMPLVFSNQFMVVNAKNHQEAIYKAQLLLEDAQTRAMLDFNLVNPMPIIQEQEYQESVNITLIDFWTKKVTGIINWHNENNQSLNVSLTTILTNPTGFIEGPDTCSSILSGNWKNATMTSYEFGKDMLIPQDTSSSFPITGIKAFNNKLYVTINNTHPNNNATFFEFDITDAHIKPAFLHSIDNDPSPGSSAGLNAIAITKDYAYVASARQIDFSKPCPSGLCGQLQIIDISSTTPTVKSTLLIPGVTGKNGQSIGLSIFYSHGYVYLGLAKTLTGPEFNIVDVKDPLNPIYKGGYAVGAAVNNLIVKNNIAYIVSPNPENLTLLDISDPTNPVRIGGYSPTGGSNGKSISVVGNTVYLGRTFGNTEFHIFDASSFSLLGSKDIGTGTSSSINNLLIRDYLAFLVTNNKFEIWNIANPTNISPFANFLDLPVGGIGTSISCNGNDLYVGSLPSNEKGYISTINPGT